MKRTLALALALTLTACSTPSYRVIEYDTNAWYFGIGSGVVGGCRIEINENIPEGVAVEYSGQRCKVRKTTGHQLDKTPLPRTGERRDETD